MDYARHYERLIARAQGRTLVGYSERHHVVPRCMGGSDVRANLVRLTAEEHFVAHKLLVRMHPGHVGLLWAAVAMTNATTRQRRAGNKLYGWLRREFAEATRRAQTGRTPSAETREKMRAAKAGKTRRPHSPETRAKMSAASKGRKKSAEHCASLSRARSGRKMGPHSAEWRANQTAGLHRWMQSRTVANLGA